VLWQGEGDGVLECWCAGTNVGADCIRPKVSQGLI